MNYSKALCELYGHVPGWKITSEDYNKLEWPSDCGVSKPSKEELDTKIAELQAAEPMKLLRIERDRLIAETDWWVLPDRTASEAQLAYRQALRDLPDNSTPVLDNTTRLGISGVTWPTKP